MPKNRYKQLEKVFSIPLGSRCREFESPHSDHAIGKFLTELADFSFYLW